MLLVPCSAPLKISRSLNGLISPSSWSRFHSNSTVAGVLKILGKEEEKTIKTWNEPGGGKKEKSWCCSRALLRDCLAALFLSCVRYLSHTTCGLHPCVFCQSSRVHASNLLRLFHLPSHSNCKVMGALNPPPPAVEKRHLLHPLRASHYLFLIPEITPLATTRGPHACHFEPH